MRARIRSIHRWLSLAMMGFWLLQALTGMLLVFQWELDDATVAGPAAPTQIAAIDSRLTALAAAEPGLRILALSTSGAGTDRYDVKLDGAGGPLTLRIDGAGHVLRRHAPGDGVSNGGLFVLAYDLHETVLAGNAGAWFVGISGLLLLSNIILGIKLAWPGKGHWGRALRPPSARAALARLYGWHRMAGLWMAVPAFITIGCGTALIFIVGIEQLAGIDRPTPSAPALAPGQAPIPMAQAVAQTQRLYPRARLTRIDYPSAAAPYYSVQVRQPGEAGLTFGSTTVAVAAMDGRIVGRTDPFAMPIEARALNMLYPIHTGEIGGLAGRVVILATGLWLTLMILLGFWLWRRRRKV